MSLNILFAYRFHDVFSYLSSLIMSAIDEKHVSESPLQESRGSENSQEISRKQSIHEIENVKLDLEGGNEAPAVWHWRQIVTTTSLAIVYVGTAQCFIVSVFTTNEDCSSRV